MKGQGVKLSGCCGSVPEHWRPKPDVFWVRLNSFNVLSPCCVQSQKPRMHYKISPVEIYQLIRVFLKTINACYKYKLLAVSYGTNAISSTVQEIQSHKITHVYRTRHETWFTSRTHSSNHDGDFTQLEHDFIKLNLFVSNGTSFRSADRRVQEIQSHTKLPVHQNHKNDLFHGLTAPYLMGMSQYFYIPL